MLLMVTTKVCLANYEIQLSHVRANIRTKLQPLACFTLYSDKTNVIDHNQNKNEYRVIVQILLIVPRVR